MDEYRWYEGCPFAPKSLIHWRVATVNQGGARLIGSRPKSYVHVGVGFPSWGRLYVHTMTRYMDLHRHELTTPSIIVTYKSSYHESTTYDIEYTGWTCSIIAKRGTYIENTAITDLLGWYSTSSDIIIGACTLRQNQ